MFLPLPEAIDSPLPRYRNHVNGASYSQSRLLRATIVSPFPLLFWLQLLSRFLSSRDRPPPASLSLPSLPLPLVRPLHPLLMNPLHCYPAGVDPLHCTSSATPSPSRRLRNSLAGPPRRYSEPKSLAPQQTCQWRVSHRPPAALHRLGRGMCERFDDLAPTLPPSSSSTRNFGSTPLPRRPPVTATGRSSARLESPSPAIRKTKDSSRPSVFVF
ncbi:hypothetical protein B0H16DRAFT_333799 [Mycena metata]|uniref:Uncharacterized protein n=1 Tax=Mycena metata TaxID=1033252 RepID=A0AAD7JMZ2_9AGAR|nr:hypothetical protein B0H16DRAFT_333799 [Mycena metata]